MQELKIQAKEAIKYYLKYKCSQHEAYTKYNISEHTFRKYLLQNKTYQKLKGL